MENKYVIINTSDVSGLTYSELVDTSPSTSRPSLDGTLTVIEYTPPLPATLSGVTLVNVNGNTTHTESETLTIMGTSTWSLSGDTI